MRSRTLLTVLTTVMSLAAMPTAPVTASARPVDQHRAASRVTIELDVKGCNGCEVQAGQNDRRGSITFLTSRVVRRGHVRLSVPTRNTRKMFFVVYAPWDELAPMAVATGFRGRPPGSHIAASYVRQRRHAATCWLGTAGQYMSNVLVVRRVQIRYSLAGPGRYTAAAGYFTRTLRSQPAAFSAPKNAIHPTEANLCR